MTLYTELHHFPGRPRRPLHPDLQRSWVNPIEAHFRPLREVVLNNSSHPNHTVLTGRLHAYLRWRNATPEPQNCWPLRAGNEPGFEPRSTVDGADPPHGSPDQLARTFVDGALEPRRLALA